MTPDHQHIATAALTFQGNTAQSAMEIKTRALNASATIFSSLLTLVAPALITPITKRHPLVME
jgi:hypothetical protein